MTRIAANDGVLLLLQEQLARLAAQRGANVRAGAVAPESAPLQRLRRTLATGALSAEERARALVRSLLLGAMDEALGTDPRFAPLADEVARIIRASDGGDALIASVLAGLAEG